MSSVRQIQSQAEVYIPVCPRSLLMKATIKLYNIRFHIKLALQTYTAMACYFIFAAMVADAVF